LQKAGVTRFLNPGSIILRKSANERREVGFIVFTRKPSLMSFHRRSFHREIKEAVARVSLETYASDNLPVVSAGLILQ
jgi:hypothetical protein